MPMTTPIMLSERPHAVAASGKKTTIIASTASFMGKFSIGKFGPVLFVLQTFCWIFTTAYVKSGIRALVRRFFVAPLAVAFDGTVNKAGSLGDFRKETLGRVCELEKIK